MAYIHVSVGFCFCFIIKLLRNRCNFATLAVEHNSAVDAAIAKKKRFERNQTVVQRKTCFLQRLATDTKGASDTNVERY